MTYYDDIAEGYNNLHEEEQLAKLKTIKQYLKPKPSDMLLDVGCGTGISSDWPCKVVGIDPSKELLKKNPHPHKLAEAESIPFEDNTFDIIISITAIQNFKDPKQALKEIKRVARPTAKIAFSILKKAKNRASIEKLINSLFSVKETIEEEKDIIYII